MGDDSNKWRDKYLDSLDQQETLEKRYKEELSLLQRALIRISVAADGQQPSLDRALEDLRSVLRSNQHDLKRLKPVLGVLDEALLQFDDKREETTQLLKGSLQSLIVPLLAQNPERPLRRQLRDLAQEVTRQKELLHGYPLLLEQLSTLQAQVLAASDEPQAEASGGGLISRLLKKKDSDEKTPLADSDDAQAATELDLDKVDRALFELNPNASLRDSATVSATMRKIITDLLLSVEAQNVAPERVQILQARLKSGISNADLLPVLEEVRDLIMTAYMAATRAFADYLRDVNAELGDIYGALDVAAESNQHMHLASSEIQEEMLAEFVQLNNDTQKATDLNQLKSQVQNRIGNIRAALDSFREKSSAASPVTEQLHTLAERLKSMELEAEKNRKVLEEQQAKAMTDPLTGVPNREAFTERARIELQRFQRYANPLSIAICDLDYFKKINDSLGHQAGDRVLKVLSNAMARRLREVDFFGRYGGEEFVILMPETTAAQALSFLDKIRAAIAKTEFNYRDQPVDITVSIGVAQFKADDTLEAAFERADKALYAAKAAGRNQCQVAE